MVDMWIEAAENKELSGVCMIDQSAAYDFLDHFLFPKKLKEYNFDEASIEWIQSYLETGNNVSRLNQRPVTSWIVKKVVPHKVWY